MMYFFNGGLSKEGSSKTSKTTTYKESLCYTASISITYGALSQCSIICTEKAGGAETCEEGENLIREFIGENLEMESKDITTERADRTGSKINGKKRVVSVKFLNYKEKDAVLNQYKQKHLWKDNIYVNKD